MIDNFRLDIVVFYAGDGAGVTVYIMDTGIRETHQEFGGRARREGDVQGDGWNVRQKWHFFYFRLSSNDMLYDEYVILSPWSTPAPTHIESRSTYARSPSSIPYFGKKIYPLSRVLDSNYWLLKNNDNNTNFRVFRFSRIIFPRETPENTPFP